MQSEIRGDSAASRIVFALDVADAHTARKLAVELHGEVGWFKIGLELFVRCGPQVASEIAPYGDIFLDLKLHDIPATMRGAVKAASGMQRVGLLSVHALNSAQALREAAKAAAGSGIGIVAVTVLTSLDQQDLREMGIQASVKGLVRERALLAQDCGCRGVVCSAAEAGEIRKACGPDFLIVTPGIRPRWEEVEKQDQKRTATPTEAIAGGADLIVVGRAIRESTSRVKAARAIAAEIASALAVVTPQKSGSRPAEQL